MMFAIGIVLFALAILISVALHECGHMWVALRTGMKVRRYFVGFGPTLWSTRRGETEYGLKAIPAGGFCDIAGMTSVEELEPDEYDRAMYKQKTWKRVAVLFAGPGMNFVIGLVLIYAIAVTWGLPNLHPTAVIGQTACAAAEVKQGDFEKCTGDGPAAAAGIRAGDVVVKVGDSPVTDFSDMAAVVQKLQGTVPVVIKRDGQTMTKYVDITQKQRWVSNGKDGAKPANVGVMGVVGTQAGPTHYNPISVVGASIIGGDTVDHGVWMAFWLFLAQLNFILGVINLVPLLPFDGGHIAIALYEKLRNMIRSARGKVAAAPVNYLKLMPATYVVLVLVVGYMLLTVTADVVNPIRLFQ
jgi:membrane-associated protease RseP (regulator of RpoE activity)